MISKNSAAEADGIRAVIDELRGVMLERHMQYGAYIEKLESERDLLIALGRDPGTIRDVALRDLIAKVSRLRSDVFHRDTLIDVAGYAILAIIVSEHVGLGDADADSRGAS